MATLICPECQQENDPLAPSCTRCGQPFLRICPRCGVGGLPTARFCSTCGVALATALQRPSFPQAGGENHLLTILFIDLSGSGSTMSSLPPEDAALLINDIFRVMMDPIVKYGGQINRLLGDEVLAFFGAPQAHEEDPERAIRAALEIREAIQGLGQNVKASINAGEVSLGPVGAESHEERERCKQI